MQYRKITKNIYISLSWTGQDKEKEYIILYNVWNSFLEHIYQEHTTLGTASTLPGAAFVQILL
jgi:hypothetical protein